MFNKKNIKIVIMTIFMMCNMFVLQASAVNSVESQTNQEISYISSDEYASGKEERQVINILENQVPLAAVPDSFSIVNVSLTVFIAVLAIFILFKDKNFNRFKLYSAVPVVLSLALLFLTQNFNGLMIYFDMWSITFLVALAMQVSILYVIKSQLKEE